MGFFATIGCGFLHMTTTISSGQKSEFALVDVLSDENDVGIAQNGSLSYIGKFCLWHPDIACEGSTALYWRSLSALQFLAKQNIAELVGVQNIVYLAGNIAFFD